MTSGTVPILALEGEPYERGLQHGGQAGEAIRAFLNDGLARLDAFLPAPLTLAGFDARLAKYGKAIASQTPDLFREIEGLATGARITLTEALLLQTRRELAGYSRFTTAGDCTTFASVAGTPLLGQTIDLAGDVEDQLCVLRISDPRTGRRSLILSFTGLAGYLGLNDRGLAIGLNLVLGGAWGPGIPPYLAIRHLLDTSDSVDDALSRLERLDLASSRSFTFCDCRTAAFVEALNGQIDVRRAPVLAHTNHFLSPAFVAQDEINVFAKNASRRRLEACEAWLAAQPADLEPERVFSLFSAEPVLVPDAGDRRREKTVAAVILDPTRGVLHLRAGDPRYTTTLRFALPEPDRAFRFGKQRSLKPLVHD